MRRGGVSNLVAMEISQLGGTGQRGNGVANLGEGGINVAVEELGFPTELVKLD